MYPFDETSGAAPEQHYSDTIEQQIAAVRLVMLISGTLIFPIWFADRPGCVPWLGYAALTAGWTYSLAVIAPRRLWGWRGIESSGFTALADAVFAVAWLHATGGHASPYFVVLALAVVSISLRFSVRETLVAASANAVAYVALLAYRGELLEHIGDTTARIVYLGISAMLGVLVVRALTTEADAKAHAREQALAERLKERLYLADRLASMGSLAASVAHEINNPLTFVLGNLDHIHASLERRNDLKELRGVLSETREGAERIRYIVRELSQFSRPMNDDAAPVAVQVREALRLAVSMSQGQIRHRARLVESYAALPPVIARPTPLGQVFLNLLVNAAQAIEPGRVDDNEITIRTSSGDDGKVLVEITDTGTGIPPEIREQIFDPFFTTKAPGTGTGLGLAISKQIVEDLGGTLTLGPNGDRGTIARVALPIATEEVTDRIQIQAQPTEGIPGPERARILIVDDEELLCRALRRALGRGHEVQTCTDAREALGILAREPFDLVLCDLMMPTMTGMDLHEAVRSHDEALAARMVFMTGGTFTPEARAFLDSVPNPVLRKPFGPELVGRILAETAPAARHPQRVERS